MTAEPDPTALPHSDYQSLYQLGAAAAWLTAGLLLISLSTVEPNLARLGRKN